MTAAPGGTAPVPAKTPPLGRVVVWVGLAAGTGVTVLAVLHGIRIPGLEVVLAVVLTWLLLVMVAVTVAELLRRHHRTAARHAWRHGKRGARLAGGYVAARAADRWQRRQPAGEPLPPYVTGWPALLTARSTTGRVLNPVTREPVNTILVKNQADLDRRLAAAARYPDLEVTVRPYHPADDSDSNPAERTHAMADTVVTDDTTEPARSRPRRGRPSGGAHSAAWNQVIAGAAGFEPEDDGHLLAWMAGEVAGMSAYAEGLTEVYETCVNTVGLDPVAMHATHDVADAAAEAASAMAAARAKFASHYAEVREFAANGGLMPFDGRWITGDGEA